MSTQFPSDNVRAEGTSGASLGPSLEKYSNAKTTLQNDFLNLDTNPDKVKQIYDKITRDIENYQNLIVQSGGDTNVSKKLSDLQESLITLENFPALLSKNVDSTKVTAVNVTQVKEAYNNAIDIISSLKGEAEPISDISVNHYLIPFATKVADDLDGIRNFNGEDNDPPIDDFVKNLKNDLKKYKIILQTLQLPPAETSSNIGKIFDEFIGTNVTNGTLDQMFSDIKAKNRLKVLDNWNSFCISAFNNLCNASFTAIRG